MIDIEKRKRIMQRSILLGHCICDAKKPCPCDLLKSQNVCLCAGERLETKSGPVKLTSLVEKAGCASKIDQAYLKAALKDMPFLSDPKVLIGAPAGDDAGVYKLSDDMALVQTVDVFTPVVDDPYAFGQIAAANSVSDIYAMGGEPLTALSVIGFPARELDDNIMRDILKGGIDKMNEAGCAVLGGHSINDAQIKAGFAVTGLIRPSQILSNAAAEPGHVLVLTKPIGTGIISFAAQIGRAASNDIAEISESMAGLNKTACELMIKHGAHSCTDVTGFSLMGHLAEMARLSGVDVEVVFDHIPLFTNVLQYASDNIIPGAIERNKESCLDRVVAGKGICQEMIDICFDAQTSGGLLVCLPLRNAKSFISELHDKGVTCAAVIGAVTGNGTGLIHLISTGSIRMPEARAIAKQHVTRETGSAACCPGGLPAEGSGDLCDDISGKFKEFVKAANSEGTLDSKTKQILSVALSLLSRCEPCLKMHIKKARAMGFSAEQIDEAAWLAIAFGGSPLMMFYNDIKKQL